MPRPPQKPDHKAMAGEVDRLLRQLRPAETQDRLTTATLRARPNRPGSRLPAPPALNLPTRHGVWARVAVGAVLTAAMTQWPYRVCGLPLVGYLVGTAVVLVAGAWAGHAAWRRRMGLPHVIAIALIFVGTALAAHQLLPRFGYTAVETAWRCHG